MKVKRKPLYTQTAEINLKTVIALSRSTNRINRSAGIVFRRHGLTTMQFAVLEVLYHKGDLKIGEIIGKVLATSGNMTVVINNLEKEGMVARNPDPEDNRSYIISITAKGIQKLELIFPDYLEDLNSTLKVLTDEEKQILTGILYKLKDKC